MGLMPKPSRTKTPSTYHCFDILPPVPYRFFPATQPAR